MNGEVILLLCKFVILHRFVNKILAFFVAYRGLKAKTCWKLYAASSYLHVSKFHLFWSFKSNATICTVGARDFSAIACKGNFGTFIISVATNGVTYQRILSLTWQECAFSNSLAGSQYRQSFQLKALKKVYFKVAFILHPYSEPHNEGYISNSVSTTQSPPGFIEEWGCVYFPPWKTRPLKIVSAHCDWGNSEDKSSGGEQNSYFFRFCWRVRDSIDRRFDLGSASKNAKIYGKRVLYLKRHPANDDYKLRKASCLKSHCRKL